MKIVQSLANGDLTKHRLIAPDKELSSIDDGRGVVGRRHVKELRRQRMLVDARSNRDSERRSCVSSVAERNNVKKDLMRLRYMT